MPIVQLNHGPIYYRHNGAVGKPALLLIHGSGGSVQHWPEKLRTLDKADVYTVDLPGHGGSGGRGRESVGDYADFIEAFVRHLGLKSVALAGHSLGGAIVQMLALRSPGWLSRVILVGTGCRLRVLPEVLNGLLTDYETTVDLMAGMLFGPDAGDVLRRRTKTLFLEKPPGILHGDLSACNAFDITDRLSEIRYPALILAGSEDRMTPVKYGEFLHRHIRESGLAVIDRAGHMMALEKPDIVARHIQRFLI